MPVSNGVYGIRCPSLFGSHHQQFSTDPAPVSYTHLDVYKRQVLYNLVECTVFY